MRQTIRQTDEQELKGKQITNNNYTCTPNNIVGGSKSGWDVFGGAARVVCVCVCVCTCLAQGFGLGQGKNAHKIIPWQQTENSRMHTHVWCDTVTHRQE